MASSRLINLKPQTNPVERKRIRRGTSCEAVPHRCHRCRGTGQSVCPICGGAGEVVRGHDIFGRVQYARCCGCFGSKTTRCSTCGGLGWT